MDYQCTQPSEEIDKIIRRTQERGIEICWQTEEVKRVHEETMQILREMIKKQEEKRIAEEKEAAEQETKRKTQECFNIEENSIPKPSRKFRIDPTLSNFKLTTKHSLCPFWYKENKGFENVIQEKKTVDPSPSIENLGSCEIKESFTPLKEPPRFYYDADFDNGEDIIPLMTISQDTGRPEKIIDKSLSDSMIFHMNSNVPRSSIAITPVTPTVENVNSLSMEDKHLDTKKDSNESSVEILVPIPSESDVISDGKCNLPVNDDSPESHFTTFSNPLFDFNDDFSSSDDESLSNEDVSNENFKNYSNPLFDDEEIISPKIDSHSFNVEYDLIESLLNHDTLIDSSPKFNYLLEEFSGELAHTDPIPLGIIDTDLEPEEEIRLAENLSYDKSSPRPPE
ncbi:hypothetical protein Tco_0677803 [Tanacetum coccineum]|uniref:Uncharacterized protein n=1 Tax=Tanacetum coccineum TaxID=301880 RepID=A0ABQ4XDD4_9ASTR